MHGDMAQTLRFFGDNTFDSIVTDPPYGLVANKKGGSGTASVNLESPYGRARIGTGNGAGGFMGMAWDASVPGVELWAELLRVLKPGGYLLAFAGTRTQHRMCCNIEDAGFEIRDMIAWVYGSGFPKSHNGEWGGTALKPAFEPITMARKPLIGTVEANWRQFGTGALAIDACRIEPTGESRSREHEAADERAAPGSTSIAASAGAFRGGDPSGRWPANLIHDGSDEVLDAFPQAGGQLAATSTDASSVKTQNVYGQLQRGGERRVEPRREDDKSAARFFYCAKASRTDRNEGCEAIPPGPLNWSSGTQNPGSFQAEGTDRTSSNNHPTVKPTELMRYLLRLVTPVGGVVLDPFAGSGSTGKAAALEGFRAVLIEREAEYVKIARARIARALDPN